MTTDRKGGNPPRRSREGAQKRLEGRVKAMWNVGEGRKGTKKRGGLPARPSFRWKLMQKKS